MKKVKFSQDKGISFYNELTAAVNDYLQGTNRRKATKIMRFKIMMYFSLDLIFYMLMMTSNTLGTFYFFYVLMGISVLLTAFNISHDAAHNVAVKGKKWNKLLFYLSFNLQGNNAYVWGKNHNESHHLYTNIAGSDIDVLNNPLVRTTRTQKLRWYHKYQYLYAPLLYLLYSLNWFFMREGLMLFGYSSRSIKITIPKKELYKLILYKLVYVGFMIVLPMYILPFSWKVILGAFVLNHLIVSIIFTAVLGVSHLSDYVHYPKVDNEGKVAISWAMVQMKSAIDYNVDSVLLNWILGGFNAHTLHHLLPHVSHVHYLKIAPILRKLCAKYDIPYMEMNYWQALSSHFRFLKTLGNEKEYTPRPYEG